MNQDQFIVRRQEQWQEMGAILDQMQYLGPRRLPLPTVQRLGRLYRQTASDLAYARTYFPGSPTVAYLNQLVARAHSAIYAQEPQRLKTLVRLFQVDVPQAVRSAWRPILLSAAFLVVGGLVGLFAVLRDANLAHALIPDQILRTVVSPQERFNMPVLMRPAIGTAIMYNNIMVGVRAFGLGITLGIGTAEELFRNGVMIGAVVAQAVPRGEAGTLWAFLLAHGSLELPAIVLCGAAGFVMGWPIIAPGELPRKAAIMQGGQRAIKLVMAAILFFVVAASIEGLVTPMTSLPPAGKLLVGAVSGTLGIAWLALSGRNRNKN